MQVSEVRNLPTMQDPPRNSRRDSINHARIIQRYFPEIVEAEEEHMINDEEHQLPCRSAPQDSKLENPPFLRVSAQNASRWQAKDCQASCHKRKCQQTVNKDKEWYRP